MTVWDTLTNSRKAIVATLGAGLAAVSAALATLPAGSSLGDISTLGWVGIGQAILVAAGGTYLVSNRDLPTPSPMVFTPLPQRVETAVAVPAQPIVTVAPVAQPVAAQAITEPPVVDSH